MSQITNKPNKIYIKKSAMYFKSNSKCTKKDCKCTLQDVYDNSDPAQVRLNVRNGPLIIQPDISDSIDTLITMQNNENTQAFLDVKQKSFFAAGAYTNSLDDNIVMGDRAESLGDRNVVIERRSEGQKSHNIALGEDAHAEEDHAQAYGRDTRARGNDSLAMMREAITNGNDSYTIGRGAQTDGDDSLSVGRCAETDADRSIAVGLGAQIENEDGVGGFIVNASGEAVVKSNSNNGFAVLPPGKGFYISAGQNQDGLVRLPGPLLYTSPNIGFVNNPINIVTTGNETLTLFDYLTDCNVSYAFQYHIHGTRIGGTTGSSGDSFYYFGRGLLVNSNNVLTLNTTNNDDLTSTAGTSINLATNGTNLRIEVTGIDDFEISWQCTLQISEFRYEFKI